MGKFYRLSNLVKIVKEHDYYDNKTLNLYGCPSCKKSFYGLLKNEKNDKRRNIKICSRFKKCI